MSTRLLYLIGVVLFGAVFYMYQINGKKLSESLNLINDGLEFKAKNITGYATSETGATELEVVAKEAQHRMNSEVYELFDLNALWHGDNQAFETKLNAALAHFNQQSSELTLGPNVVVNHKDFDPNEQFNSMNLITGELVANLNTQILKTNQPAQVTLPNAELNVGSLEANLATGEYQFGSVSGVMQRVR